MEEENIIILKISDFEIFSNGVDGGHKYIVAQVEFNNEIRRISIIFQNKSDESRLNILNSLTVKGELINDGNEDLLMTQAIILDN
ncbi:hypothetical protein D3C87_158690 [compost metagenome]